MPSHEVLFERMPARGRVLSESLLVVTLFFLPARVVSALPERWAWHALAAALLLWGGWALALTRRGRVTAVAAVAGVAAMLWSTTVRAPRAPPRLGVETADRPGCAGVTRTIAGSPAEGRIRPGDCITAMARIPVDAAAPSADLRARLNDPKRQPAGATVVAVIRDGAPLDVEVLLGSVPDGPQLGGSDLPWLILRSLAALAIVAALLAADGQSARNIGLDPARLPRELLYGVPVLGGAFAVHLAVAVPVAASLSILGRAQGEMAQRVGALQGLATEVHMWQLVPALVVLAALEEVVFRGFLLPRVRRLVGHWLLAVAVVQLLFGLGHLYEGAFAVVQTMMLGVYFSVVFLWRVHLGAVISAHTAFNAIMFALVLLLQRSGLLEKLQALR